MESRKRPHSLEDEPTIQKKLKISSMNGTPHLNGVVNDADEPKDSDNLELFRKEAIFRKMKHYSREHERSQAQIAALEQRRNTCEAGMVAIAACWEQLVAAIRTLARPEDLPPADEVTVGLFNLTEHVSNDREPALKSALESNMQSTQKLITSFMQMGDREPKILRDQAFKQCQTAQNECIALRSEIALVRNELLETQAQNQQYRADLVAAETRADRLRSSTVQAMQARTLEKQEQSEAEEKSEAPTPQAPASPPQLQVNGMAQFAAEQSGLLENLNSRDAKISELEHERALIQDEMHVLKMNLKFPNDVVADTPAYQALLAHASKLEKTIKDSGDELPLLREEVIKLQASRKEWEESVLSAAELAKEDLKAQLVRREAETLRLRDQREQQTSELNERKHKDSVKLASLNELKTLSEARSERIVVLESELKRCKAQLAANAGNSDLLAFFLRSSEDVSYVDDLQKRLNVAETHAASLEESLSRLDNDQPDIRQHITAETEARQQLADVKKQLEKYQSVYGDTSSSTPDIQQLSAELQKKEDEVQKLRLLDTQRSEAETSLYAELDKLSAAWEALDRQVKSKVFDLTSMEERLAKMGHDRGKSENKFYAAMRDKEALENERKNLTRNLEKQTKVIERLQESEKNLSLQVVSFEKEVAVLQKGTEELKAKCTTLEQQFLDWHARAENEHARTKEYRTLLKERDAAVDAKATEVRRVEEELVRVKKDAERQQSKYKLMATGSSSQKEAELQQDLDKVWAVLKCSTCKQRMRNTVITKCMHTFCRECVDARISTRQRKCPACNLGFAASDAQAVYYQ